MSNKLGVPLLVAISMALANPLQAKEEFTPYQELVALMSFDICAKEYGKDALQAMVDTEVDQYPEQVVMNIVNDDNFENRVITHIQESGGCGEIVELLEAAVRE